MPADMHDLSAFAFALLKETEERRARALREEADGRPLIPEATAGDDGRCVCGRWGCHGRCSPNHDRPPRWERG